MKLAYTAYDGLGKATSGVIEAADLVAATDTLRRKGLYVSDIGETTGAVVKKVARRRRRLSGSRKAKNLALFTRQLYVLTSSGMQLLGALMALERQAPVGPWRDVVGHLRARVEEGASLSEAMQDHPNYFDSIYCSLIAVGESSGCLGDMLSRLATLKQKQLKTRNTVVGALIYPFMLIILAMAIFSMLLIFVVPKFAELFQTLDVPLPSTTVMLVDLSDLVRHYWWLILLLLSGSVAGLVAYLRTPRGTYFRHSALLKVPGAGGIAKNFATARIVGLLGVLMAAHVPLLQALKLVRHAAGNLRYEELVAKAEDHVTRGEPLNLAFSEPDLVSPSVQEAIRSGEESGQIDQLLLNVASFLDEENEVVVRSLTSIIEPVILIVMGLLVGLVAVCMFLPLFDLTAMTGGGK